MGQDDGSICFHSSELRIFWLYNDGYLGASNSGASKLLSVHFDSLLSRVHDVKAALYRGAHSQGL
jgi:hypothetical protein